MIKIQKKKKWKPRVFKYGDIFYVQGYPTKIRIIGDFEAKKPLCEILAVAKHSIYEIGQVENIPRNILYPRQEAHRKRSYYDK